MTVKLLLLFDGLLVLFSAYFGTRAILMFRKTDIGRVVDKLNTDEKHKLMLLYSSVFLGVTLITLSIVQGMIYLMDTRISCSELVITTVYSCSELVMSAVYLSFLAITYSWNSFLKDLRLEGGNSRSSPSAK
jgi:hypothetical protein